MSFFFMSGKVDMLNDVEKVKNVLEVVESGESTCSRMDGEMAQSCVRNSDRSEGKAGFGFGGR